MSEKESYDKQQKLSFLELFLEIPNFVAVTGAALLTGSLITWMDFVDSLGNVISASFIAGLSAKLKRNLKFEYNYGIEKIEAIASLCCEFFVLSGLFCVCFFSITEIITPKRPSDLLFFPILVKIINVGGDIYFLIQQRKLCGNGGRIARSEYKAIIQGLVFDLISLAALFISYVLRDNRGAWYFAPVLCLLASVYFFADSFSRIHEAVQELTDKTLPEEKQLLILKTLNACYSDYETLISINSHLVGRRIFIDLHLKFNENTSYGEIESFQKKISEIIRKELPNSIVSIMISDE